jgi:DNA-binding transcriptional LysR family regulator
MDRLDELTLFLAIADAGSLAAAARRTGRSPPAVTRILHDLEERLGVRLFERTTRQLALTDAGLRLAEHARQLLADFEEAMRDTAGEAAAPRGRLRISAPVVFGQRYVTPIVTAFLDLYPEVTAELSLVDRTVDLIEEGIDVAVRISHLASSSLVARRLGAVRVSARFQVDRAEAAIAAARDGRGILAALSYQVAPDLASGALVRVLDRFERPPIPVHLVYPGGRLITPRLRAFLDFVAPRLSQLNELRQPG